MPLPRIAIAGRSKRRVTVEHGQYVFSTGTVSDAVTQAAANTITL